MKWNRFMRLFSALWIGIPLLAHAGDLADAFKASATNLQRLTTARFFERRVDPLQNQITEIGLERAGCFGPCPKYMVIIKSDGSFRYVGIERTKQGGSPTTTGPLEYLGKVRPWELLQLYRLVEEVEFMNLADEYTVPVTDMETVYTSVTRDGKRKIIKNYGNGGPGTLWAIEQVIERMLWDAEWKGPRPDRFTVK